MVLELTTDQVAALIEIDAKRFVERVRQDLIQENPRFCSDPSLPSRLRLAIQAARELGIQKDGNLVAFLRVEAYMPRFYARPAICAWLTRAGRSGDQRFEDYQRVVRWRIEHPEIAEGTLNASICDSAIGSSSGGTWPHIVAGWRRIVGWRDRGRNGKSSR